MLGQAPRVKDLYPQEINLCFFNPETTSGLSSILVKHCMFPHHQLCVNCVVTAYIISIKAKTLSFQPGFLVSFQYCFSSRGKRKGIRSNLSKTHQYKPSSCAVYPRAWEVSTMSFRGGFSCQRYLPCNYQQIQIPNSCFLTKISFLH